jgi:hypothetical protein
VDNQCTSLALSQNPWVNSGSGNPISRDLDVLCQPILSLSFLTFDTAELMSGFADHQVQTILF